MIGEVAKPAEYYGTNKRFYQTNGFNPALQNMANNFPALGERTMITTARSGQEDLRRGSGMLDKEASIRGGIYSSRGC
jgi:hypothetical protein